MHTHIEDLAVILGQTGAVEADNTELLDLTQGAPVHVGRAEVEVLPVDQPHLRMQNSSTQ